MVARVIRLRQGRLVAAIDRILHRQHRRSSRGRQRDVKIDRRAKMRSVGSSSEKYVTITMF